MFDILRLAVQSGPTKVASNLVKAITTFLHTKDATEQAMAALEGWTDHKVAGIGSANGTAYTL